MLAVTSLGVLLFITSASGYLDLKQSYADTCARLALAGLHVDVPSLVRGATGRVARLPGVRPPMRVSSLRCRWGCRATTPRGWSCGC